MYVYRLANIYFLQKVTSCLAPKKQDFWPKKTYSREVLIFCERNKWGVMVEKNEFQN